MKILIFVIFFSILFSFNVEATDNLSDDLGINELENAIPKEALDIFGEIDADAEGFEENLRKLWDYLLSHTGQFLSSGIRSAFSILVILMLCSMAKSVSDGKLPEFVSLGGALGIATVAVSDVSAFIGMGESTLRTLDDFASLLLPCIAAATAATGSVTSASASYAATALFMDVLISLCVGVVMPLIYVYIAAICAKAALGTEVLSAAANFSKWACISLMTLLVTIFTAYLTVSGVVASSGDMVAAKLTKSAISAALPVVGGIVSGAAGSVVAGAMALRAGVGVLGMLVVLAVCATPFLSLFIHYLIYKGTSAIGTGFADSRMSEMIGGIGTAFGMVLGLVGCGAIMLFISIVSAMRAVSPV